MFADSQTGSSWVSEAAATWVAGDRTRLRCVMAMSVSLLLWSQWFAWSLTACCMAQCVGTVCALRSSFRVFLLLTARPSSNTFIAPLQQMIDGTALGQLSLGAAGVRMAAFCRSVVLACSVWFPAGADHTWPPWPAHSGVHTSYQQSGYEQAGVKPNRSAPVQSLICVSPKAEEGLHAFVAAKSNACSGSVCVCLCVLHCCSNGCRSHLHALCVLLSCGSSLSFSFPPRCTLCNPHPSLRQLQTPHGFNFAGLGYDCQRLVPVIYCHMSLCTEPFGVGAGFKSVHFQASAVPQILSACVAGVRVRVCVCCCKSPDTGSQD